MTEPHLQITQEELTQFWGADIQELTPEMKQILSRIILKLKEAQRDQELRTAS